MKHLDHLNAEQRRAVEHGIGAGTTSAAGPLLIIAGAGSGKTMTLASRVAHLIVNGADPGRILLLTFSSRAAAEMDRRVERTVAAALGEAGAISRRRRLGGYVSCGRCAPHAPLRRPHRPSPGFTIHDREDAADHLRLVQQATLSPVAHNWAADK